jgi:hypothetical protein
VLEDAIDFGFELLVKNGLLEILCGLEASKLLE